MSNSMNQSTIDQNDTTSENMEISEQELAQGEKLTQIADTADPGSATGSVSTAPLDMEVEPTTNTRDPPTVNVDDSAALDAVPSDQGTSGERQSIQPTAPSDSEMAVEPLAPRSEEVNSVVRPGSLPTFNVDDSATLDALLSHQGTSGEGQSIQPTAPSDPEIAGDSLVPPNEVDSMVQPGRQVFDSQLPPELLGSLTTGEKLDGGQFADVHVGELEHPDGTKTSVAIKFIRRTDGATEKRFHMRIKREAVIWKAADHPNILRFVGYKIVEGIPWLVSPLCKHGNLTKYIEKTPGITKAEKLDLLSGAARGLVHLHSLEPRIVHADIKPGNVVIQDDLQAALCDFGLSRIILGLGSPSGLTTTGSKVGGTAGYQAKELLEGIAPTPAGDVFAFGGLILAAMSGRDPLYNRKNDAARIVATCMDQIPVPKDHPGLPEADPLWTLLRACWSTDPKDRPTMDTVLQKLEAEKDSAGKTPVPSVASLPPSGTTESNLE